jgi:hypothetical protein
MIRCTGKHVLKVCAGLGVVVMIGCSALRPSDLQTSQQVSAFQAEDFRITVGGDKQAEPTALVRLSAELIRLSSTTTTSAIGGQPDPAVNFQWLQLEGPPVMLTNDAAANTTFLAPSTDHYPLSLVFQVRAYGDGFELTDEVAITLVEPGTGPVPLGGDVAGGGGLTQEQLLASIPPVAVAGVNIHVEAHDEVVLDGRDSYDEDGDVLQYFWTQTAGTAVQLVQENEGVVVFIAPALQQQESLLFTLSVNDGIHTTLDQVAITVVGKGETAPVADAGPDQIAAIGDYVTLNGNNSENPMGGTFTWRQLAGTLVSLSAATSAVASFVAPEVDGEETLVFELTVAGVGYMVTDTVSVHVVSGPQSTSDDDPLEEFAQDDETELEEIGDDDDDEDEDEDEEVDNQPPTAITQSVTVQYNTPLNITLSGSDPETSALEFTVVDQPTHGTLTGTAPNLTYTPTTGYQGADSFRFVVSDGELVSGEATVSLTITGPITTTSGDWEAPIGIPAPSFGIAETAGAPTYYIDKNHPSATDTDNPNGTPGTPRLTIPQPLNLVPGDVVAIAPGSYTHTGDNKTFNGSGTAAQPIFIRGTSATNRPKFDKKLSVENGNSFVIIENIEFDASSTGVAGLVIVAPSHHIAVRNCDLHHRNGSCVQVSSYTDTASVTDVVLFNNKIHDNGDWQADFDQDYHGIAVGHHVERLWIVDNELYHNSGDGIQINAGSLARLDTTHHIYVGRNLSYENKQTGMWVKQARDVIFSQNTVHSHRPVGSSPSAFGAGMGFQYGPENVWFIFNKIYNCDFGIQVNSTSGLGDGENSYYIGNVMYDIHHTPGYSYTPEGYYNSAGIMIVGGVNRHIYNNTMNDVDAGINCAGGGSYLMGNNIISNVTETQSHHIGMNHAASAAQSSIDNNFLGGTARIRWGSSTVHDLFSLTAAFPGVAQGTEQGTPQFVSSGSADFHLQAGSPAVDSGAAVQNVFNRFQTLYGLDIEVDFDGEDRPQGGGYDVGAFER